MRAFGLDQELERRINQLAQSRGLTPPDVVREYVSRRGRRSIG